MEETPTDTEGAVMLLQKIRTNTNDQKNETTVTLT